MKDSIDRMHTTESNDGRGNNTMDKLIKIERSIAKLDSEMATLTTLTSFKEHIPGLIKIQQNINDIKKKSNTAIATLDTKAEKFEQVQQIFVDANNSTNKQLQEEINAREADVQRLFNKIASLEKELKASTLKTAIEMEERDIKHQEDMVRVAKELNQQVESEKEFVINALYMNEKKAQNSKNVNVATIVYVASPLAYLYPIQEANQENLRNIMIYLLSGKILKDSEQEIKEYDKAVCSIDKDAKVLIIERLKKYAKLEGDCILLSKKAQMLDKDSISKFNNDINQLRQQLTIS